MLTPYEKETIISGNEEDNAWSVYTYNPDLKRRLARFSRVCPKSCVKLGATADGSATWRILKDCLVIDFRKPDAGEKLKG